MKKSTPKRRKTPQKHRKMAINAPWATRIAAKQTAVLFFSYIKNKNFKKKKKKIRFI
jgi:YbbR domain-containing protein